MKTLNTPKSPRAPRSEAQLPDSWNASTIRALIHRKTVAGNTPAFLFLGQHELNLLRLHLGAAFGAETVQATQNLYYMGLEVIEVDEPSYLRTAGMKRVRGLEEALNRTPTAGDLEASSFWRFALL